MKSSRGKRSLSYNNRPSCKWHVDISNRDKPGMVKYFESNKRRRGRLRQSCYLMHSQSRREKQPFMLWLFSNGNELVKKRSAPKYIPLRRVKPGSRMSIS